MDVSHPSKYVRRTKHIILYYKYGKYSTTHLCTYTRSQAVKRTVAVVMAARVVVGGGCWKTLTAPRASATLKHINTIAMATHVDGFSVLEGGKSSAEGPHHPFHPGIRPVPCGIIIKLSSVG